MIQEEFKVRVLRPTEGHLLTQAQEVELQNRVFSDKVFLAVTDSPTNWREITIAEAETIKAEQERMAEEQTKTNE